MFALYDIVVLREDDPEAGVKAGTEGTVVDIQDGGKACTVEFFDENGDMIEDALFKDYLPEQLKKKTSADWPAFSYPLFQMEQASPSGGVFFIIFSRTRPATRRDREGRGSRHINSGERNTYRL